MFACHCNAHTQSYTHRQKYTWTLSLTLCARHDVPHLGVRPVQTGVRLVQSLEEKTAQPTQKSTPYETIVIFRPLKVEIYRSAVSTDCFHTKSISSEQQKILTYYLIFADESADIIIHDLGLGVRLTCARNRVSIYYLISNHLCFYSLVWGPAVCSPVSSCIHYLPPAFFSYPQYSLVNTYVLCSFAFVFISSLEHLTVIRGVYTQSTCFEASKPCVRLLYR